MNVQLLVVRHGNTFGPGDDVVWVGKGEDLPLVDSGRAQARALGTALKECEWTPGTAVSGDLARQTEHLDLAVDSSVPRIHTDALDEVDYGPWGGLSTEDIIARFGAAEITAWSERSAWPVSSGWPESRHEVIARVHAFAGHVAEGEYGQRVLVCSSNGVLRWMLDLVPGGLRQAVTDGTFKVKTGHAGLLTCETLAGGEVVWKIACWNVPPDEIGQHLSPQ